ncbi:MAG: response regulator transcription factor [Bacteroidales bacterium]|nr:response regulator transcription factor [Candidatus Liminaster caballi]
MKIYIAEDEPLAAAKLKVFLEKLGEGTDVSHFDNGITALAAIRRELPDVLFLDIQMPGLTGMQILESMRESGITGNQPCVIITSAYDSYAIDSFSFDVTDYLLKPYTLDRLRTAIEKAKNILRLRALDKKIHATTITVRCDGRTEILPTAEILCLESLKDYVRIKMAGGRHLLTLATMASLLEQLPNDDFARVHRSYIVNVNAIKSIGQQTLILTDGTEIAVGKTYRKDFETLINK